MKLTNTIVKHFENEQKEFGTKIALQNILWQVAAGLFRDLGIKSIKTK